ncbi:hypothetical protein L0244_39550 [bacterium]|nr:hypothetical protein [bacterium]MCI0619105.1 hypothetical protein [bacterium]
MSTYSVGNSKSNVPQVRKPEDQIMDQMIIYSSDDAGRFEGVKEEFQKLSPAEAKTMLARLNGNNSKDELSKRFKTSFKGPAAQELKQVLTARFNPGALVSADMKKPPKPNPTDANSKKADLNAAGSAQQAKMQAQLKPGPSEQVIQNLVNSKQPVTKPGEQLSWKEKQALDGYLSSAKPDEFKKILSDSKNWSLDAQVNLYQVIGDNDRLAGRIAKEFKGDDLLEVTNRTLQFYNGKNNFKAALIDKADLADMPNLINKAYFGGDVMRHPRGAEILDSLDLRTKENAMYTILTDVRDHGRQGFLEAKNFHRTLSSLTPDQQRSFLQNANNKGLVTPRIMDALDPVKEQRMLEEMTKKMEEQIKEKMQVLSR